MSFKNTSIIDIESNEYKIDHQKSIGLYSNLALDVPLKIEFVFTEIENETQFIKLFRVRTSSKPEINLFKEIRSDIGFRDLKEIWD